VYKRTQDSRVGNTFYDVEDWEDEHFTSTVGFASLGVRRQVKKNGSVIYKDTLRYVFYGTVTDVISGDHPDNEVHICPNCGADSTIEELQNGCPYCGTQYKMDDLFPKITSYYFFDQLRITRKQLLIGWPLCSLFCAIAALVFIPVLKSSPMLWRTIESNFLSSTPTAIISCIVAIAGYGFFLFLLAHLLLKIVQAVFDRDRMGTAASRNRFEIRMKKITPEFSYEYFKNKAISLIKTAVYSEDESELLCYGGDQLPSEFKDIIDLNYAGTFGIKDFSEDKGMVTVDTRSYFDILSVNGNKVSYTHPVISATFRRRTDIPVNLNFKMTRIQCPSCGTSFNPVKNKFCPSCGNEYELITDDWVLVDLKRIDRSSY
jgi:rubrerythrin